MPNRANAIPSGLCQRHRQRGPDHIGVKACSGAYANSGRALAARADGGRTNRAWPSEGAAMSEREAFDRILASLHEAALDDAHWSTASGLIDEALRAHGSSMVFGDGDSEEDIRIYFLWQFFRQALAGAGAPAPYPVGASLAELLDTTGLGIVQLDGRGRIVTANDRARDMLRGGDGLFDEDGFLCARAPEDNAALEGLLTRALPRFGGQGAGGSTMVRRSSAMPPLVLHVNPVGRQETDFHLWPVAALVLVADPASRTRIDPAVAAEALGLTGVESRVAVLLAEGMSVREVAAATGRKESTIRSHVKHMFAKHGLSRQAELVQLVLSLASAPESRR